MSSRTRENGQLHAAVTDVLNAHHLLGVLDLGAPADEYDPEAEDFTRLTVTGEDITPVVAAHLSEVQHTYGAGRRRE